MKVHGNMPEQVRKFNYIVLPDVEYDALTEEAEARTNPLVPTIASRAAIVHY